MESTSLELLHTIQLDMLIKFDKICSENHLTYFLDSGTALGAIRHGGFIPWDDDVDVAMPREDYNLLVEIGKKGFPDDLFMQTFETDPNYMCPFGKIRLGGSYFPDIGVDQMKYQGIYIDVFPFDKVPDNHLMASLRIKFSRVLWFICVFCRREYPGRKISLQVLSALLHRLSNNKKLLLYRLYDKYCTQFNMKKKNTWTCFCWNMSQHCVYLFNYGELFPTTSIGFEGKELRIMHDAHSYLTKMYGDYRVLPPEIKRKSHLRGQPFQVFTV